MAKQLPAILGGGPVRPTGVPCWPQEDPLVRAALLKMIESSDWGRYHGPHIPKLCQRLADYHQVEHVLPCSSGTAAVELALRGVGVAAGDEVILAGYDFKANFQNILRLQATPVLIDIDPESWQMDVTRLEASVSTRTRAILISHLHGGVVDAPLARQCADRHGIPLIEDACQNPGAMLHGRVSGTWGDVGVLSFGGSKLLTAGRGGAVITARSDVAERIKRYIHRGNEAYPLSEMQAAILVPQLEQLDDKNDLRRHSVSRLHDGLQGLEGLTLIQIPTECVKPTYYKVGFRYAAEKFAGLPRDRFAESLRAEGIAFDAGFRGLHLIHGSRRFRAADPLSEVTCADAKVLTLHHPILLEEGSAIEDVIVAVHKIREWSTEITARLGPATRDVEQPLSRL